MTGTCDTTNEGQEYCTCPNGYTLTMTDNVTGICESKYVLYISLLKWEFYSE